MNTSVIKKGLRCKLFLYFLMASAGDLLPFWVICSSVLMSIYEHSKLNDLFLACDCAKFHDSFSP